MRPPRLTSRQRDVITLLCAGWTPEMIAVELRIRRVTVYRHIALVASRLAGHDRPMQKVVRSCALLLDAPDAMPLQQKTG